MGVDSYLELFTTLYGWYFGSIVWNVLAATGVIFLPFLAVLIAVWREAHEMGDEGGAVPWMIRKMEMELIAAIVVFALCVVPNNITSLSNTGLVYTPLATAAEPSPVAATPANPDSTLGNPEVFGSSLPSVAAIPPWWYAVMSISSGVNAAAKAGINTGIRDFRQLEDLARIAAVEDPRLRKSIQRFYSECFVPARSMYLRAESPSPAAAAAIAAHGQADVDWIGSHAFLDDPSLYRTLRAADDVPGFPYDPARDVDVNPALPSGGLPALGRPSCADWWLGNGGPGLRDEMVNAVGTRNQLWNKFKAVFTGASEDQLKDHLARLALTKASPSYLNPEAIVGDDRGWGDKLLHAPSDVMGVLGAGWEAFKASATMMPLMTLITMAQPLVLMAMYMFLPVIIMFGSYRLSMMVYGAIGIFSVKFWSVMWFVARWLDDHLIASMYPGASGNVLIEGITTGLDGSYKRMMLNILLMAMYIGLPLVWTGLLAWTGFKIGHGIDSLYQRATDTGERSGANGANIAANAAKTALVKGR